MKRLIITSGVVLLFAGAAFAHEQSVLARITGYWRAEGCGQTASWNGARLRVGHCAVDPKRIPFGSKVVFPDAECMAVDSGPDVINRKAARLCGRTVRERDAIVIDRFFETKQQALAWAKAHPEFMTVRVVLPRSRSEPPVEQWQTNVTHVAQTSVPLPIRHREDDSAVAVAFKTPQRQLISAPPSYHRRRFAADKSDDGDLPPLDWTARPINRFCFL